MVLVSVGDHDSAETIAVLLKVGEIRNDKVNAGHVVVRESKSAVHDEHVVAALVDVQVLSNLVESAKSRELHGSRADLARLFLHRLALWLFGILTLAALALLGTGFLRLLDGGESCTVLLVVFSFALRLLFLLFGLLRLYALSLVLGGDVFCFCEEFAVCQ